MQEINNTQHKEDISTTAPTHKYKQQKGVRLQSYWGPAQFEWMDEHGNEEWWQERENDGAIKWQSEVVMFTFRCVCRLKALLHTLQT